MPSFNQRSYKKELLDGDTISFADIKQNMRELDSINHLLGGHQITLDGIKTLIKECNEQKVWRIVEIGCGGGDNLRVIKNWAAKKNLAIELTGIDINEECIAYAKSLSANAGIYFICSDYRNVGFVKKPHIIFSSLFCHHFTDEALVYMLRWLQQNSLTGFFINDLHRHPIAYYSIKLFTRLFSKSYLVKNDAPLSVQRSFKRKDLERLFLAAGISNFSIEWKWAFRWLVTCYT
ncbi:MAG: methyltransferase domain-containing protein [Bacteroidota bacterium]|nr:methyltransferase domain-containing protein [Bacteroidota bacterium]